MKHADFHAALASHALTEAGRASQMDAEAEDARDRKAQSKQMWPQGMPEYEAHKYESAITTAENQAAIHRRRSDFAKSGFLVHGDCESRDSELCSRPGHMDMVAFANRHSLLKV